ncbi:cell division protein FtsQ/DivIB [Oceanobacter mangrovi]|uniref:cell division protein FtsQ/DivIB n=1 Tax=Oceanobacter mangrovi TaxID=2862510 RepID=UPI001C8D01AF|nr:cell division protein FtsQ/DivIB [Oceanobacter mangrovi]
MAKDKLPPAGATLRPEPRQPLRQRFSFRIRVPRFVWIGLFAVLALGSLSWLANDMYRSWPVKDVVVVGELDALNPRDLAASLLWVKNESFFTLDVEKVQQQIAAMPMVARVAVRKKWPGSVELLVYEDVPVALWNDEYLVTASGRISPLPDGYSDQGLMRLYGDEAAKQSSVRYFRRAQQVLQGSGVSVESMNVNAVQSVDITLSNGWVVRLGRQYFEERLQRLQVLLTRLDQKVVQQVDLRYGKGAAIRWNTEGVTG